MMFVGGGGNLFVKGVVVHERIYGTDKHIDEQNCIIFIRSDSPVLKRIRQLIQNPYVIYKLNDISHNGRIV